MKRKEFEKQHGFDPLPGGDWVELSGFNKAEVDELEYEIEGKSVAIYFEGICIDGYDIEN